MVNSNNDTDAESKSSAKKGTGYISGVTFGPKKVEFSIIDGLAVFEGDIILGKAEELEKTSFSAEAVIVVGQRFRWPSGVVPFTIDPNLPNPSRVQEAINHWHINTAIRVVTRTNEANFVTFIKGGFACSAHVGMLGIGQQQILLNDLCRTREIIHEIGHTVGLWHEQSREDRNIFVRINYENVEPGKEGNFNQHITDGDDYAGYDYCSIMHYPATAFTKNGQPTITVLRTDLPCASTIGQTNVLSEGDKLAVRYMYVPTTVPDVMDFGVNPAVQRLKQAELVAKLVNADSVVEIQSPLAGSWVMHQSPRPGNNVSRGSIVTLYWTNRPRP